MTAVPRFDEIHDQIHDHPWSTVAFAALAGVWLATHHKSSRASGLVAGAVSALVIQFVRGAAMRQMTKLAKSWVGTAPAAPTVPTPYAR